MIKKKNVVLVCWFLCLLLVVVFASIFKSVDSISNTDNDLYTKMIEASEKAKLANDEIKKYKINEGIGISIEDILNTGLIGTNKRTTITTTEGVLEAKRTTCNPEWAGSLVKTFKKNGLKEGDEVGLIFSSSFPALNICALAACEVYGLKTCVMASIGASYYGANQVDCTFIDMMNIVNSKGIINIKVDYYSLGGASDIGYTFKEPFRSEIIEKINSSSAEFLYCEDFKDNIDNRLKLINEAIPDMKLFINCGGSLVAYGEGIKAFSESGYFKGMKSKRTLNEVLKNRDKRVGLLECVRLMGVDVYSMKDIKTLSNVHGLPYDPVVMPEIGDSACFYNDKYNVLFPIIGLIISLAFGNIYYIINKKKFD